LIPQFEQASGHTVKLIWDGTPVIAKRIAGAEAVEIVRVPASAIDDLIKRGLSP
jgi:hypothetical protein